MSSLPSIDDKKLSGGGTSCAGGSSSRSSAYEAFTIVDEMVAKPVLGSDGAALWQDFQKKNNKGTSATANNVAPKAPLKKSDRASGFTSWEDERQNELQIRQLTNTVNATGYTHFKKRKQQEDDDNNNVEARKERKRIEQRIRPDDKEYFLPSKTYQGSKFDYVFTTKENYGTGYYFDGMDSYKQLLLQQQQQKSGGDDDDNIDSNNNGSIQFDKSKITKSANDDIQPTVKKKKKKKDNNNKQLPVIIDNPNNPIEQVAAALQRRQEKLLLQQQQQQQQQMSSSISNNNGTGPFIASSSSIASLPEGWNSTIDKISKKEYYYNSITGERSWEKPVIITKTTTTNTTSTTSTISPVITEKTIKQEQQQEVKNSLLPLGWNSATDVTTGKQYYYNTSTGQTCWEIPTLLWQ